MDERLEQCIDLISEVWNKTTELEQERITGMILGMAMVIKKSEKTA